MSPKKTIFNHQTESSQASNSFHLNKLQLIISTNLTNISTTSQKLKKTKPSTIFTIQQFALSLLNQIP